MKKSVIICIAIVLLTLSVRGQRGLTDDQQNITRISTLACHIGETRCFSKAFQECDGMFFVMKQICGLQEVCDTNKGCIPRPQKVAAPKTGVSHEFENWRYQECREGQIKCNKRVIKTCKNHRWVEGQCHANEYCHPTQGCVAKPKTILKRREVGLPFPSQSPLAQRRPKVLG